MVKHNYVATNQDELSLCQGETVQIFAKDPNRTGDVGWWYGAVGKRSGVFPLNYVVEKSEAPTQGHEEPEATPVLPATSVLHEIAASELSISTLLGQGGFGRVYRGTYGGSDVAVKQFR